MDFRKGIEIIELPEKVLDQDMARRFKEHRKQSGLTQTQIAKKIGVSASWVYSYEKGALKLSEKMKTVITDLIGGTGNERE